MSFRIAGFEICPIPTGFFALDGGAMFGTVPKVLWEKAIPPDEKNRIPMEARALLLKSATRNILIDTGNGSDFVAKYGDKLGHKFAEMYGVNPNGPSLLKSLEQHQVKPEQVTDVILTHLHFDHAGGATCAREGKIQATFPHAKYYVQKKNLDVAENPNIREKASYLKPNFEPLLESKQLQLLEGPAEIAPGVSVFISNGHTQAQQLVKIQDDKETLIYCGDLIPTSAHIRLAWIMGYDLDPLTLIEEKRQLLSEAADHNWHLFFEHDPVTDTCKVVRNGSDFARA